MEYSPSTAAQYIWQKAYIQYTFSPMVIGLAAVQQPSMLAWPVTKPGGRSELAYR